jgi:hypothetical protein
MFIGLANQVVLMESHIWWQRSIVCSSKCSCSSYTYFSIQLFEIKGRAECWGKSFNTHVHFWQRISLSQICHNDRKEKQMCLNATSWTVGFSRVVKMQTLKLWQHMKIWQTSIIHGQYFKMKIVESFCVMMQNNLVTFD